MVVILGVVGKTSVPQFVETSTEEKISELIDGLEAVRGHLDLYCAHHGGYLPPFSSFASFQTAMTTRAGHYEPYIKKIPVNPFNGLDVVRFDGEPAGCGKAGWRLDTRSGLFQADNNAAYAVL